MSQTISPGHVSRNAPEGQVQSCRGAGCEVLHQHVGVLQVGGQAAHALVIRSREVTDTRPLDLDHARAEIRQLPRAEGGGDGVLNGDDLDSVQGTHLFSTSEGARQAEHVLGQIGQDQVGRDRGDLVEPGLAELALDVVLGGEAEAAVGLQADVGGLPGGLRGEVLRHVRLGAAGLFLVEEAAGLEAHQVRGLDLHVGLGDRELDALVLADRAVEHDALVGIVGATLSMNQ